MNAAYFTAPFLILIIGHAWLSLVYCQSRPIRNCRHSLQGTILCLALFLWTGVTALTYFNLLLPSAAGVVTARHWGQILLPLLLLTYLVVAMHFGRRLTLLVTVLVWLCYILLYAALLIYGKSHHWPWLYMLPLVLAIALRPWFTGIVRDRASWIGVSVVPVTILLPTVNADFQQMVFSVCGIVAGILWKVSASTRYAYGLWVPSAVSTTSKNEQFSDVSKIKPALTHLESLLGAPVAIFSRYTFELSGNNAQHLKLSSINMAALELCEHLLWIDDSLEISALIYQEMVRLNIAVIAPLPGWISPHSIGGWLVIGKPDAPKRLEKLDLYNTYSELYRSFIKMDAANAALHIENMSVLSRLSSQITLLSERIAKSNAGEKTHHQAILRTYSDNLIARGVSRFTELASQRRHVVTYLGSDRELIWSLRKYIPMLRYVQSSKRIGEHNDVIIYDIDTVKTIERDSLIAWLMICRPVRILILGRESLHTSVQNSAESAFTRHDVSFIPSRNTSHICDALSPASEQTSAYVAKASGYAIEHEIQYLERDMAQNAMELSNGNIHKAAQLLGIASNTLARRLQRLPDGLVQEVDKIGATDEHGG